MRSPRPAIGRSTYDQRWRAMPYRHTQPTASVYKKLRGKWGAARRPRGLSTRRTVVRSPRGPTRQVPMRAGQDRQPRSPKATNRLGLFCTTGRWWPGLPHRCSSRLRCPPWPCLVPWCRVVQRGVCPPCFEKQAQNTSKKPARNAWADSSGTTPSHQRAAANGYIHGGNLGATTVFSG
jgi:hypothetical protein